ncbi:MAG: hypothetical protein ABSC89_07820 [Verrucomicrobiota bacterium]
MILLPKKALAEQKTKQTTEKKHEKSKAGPVCGRLGIARRHFDAGSVCGSAAGVALRLRSRRLSACAALSPLAARRPKPKIRICRQNDEFIYGFFADSDFHITD